MSPSRPSPKWRWRAKAELPLDAPLTPSHPSQNRWLLHHPHDPTPLPPYGLYSLAIRLCLWNMPPSSVLLTFSVGTEMEMMRWCLRWDGGMRRYIKTIVMFYSSSQGSFFLQQGTALHSLPPGRCMAGQKKSGQQVCPVLLFPRGTTLCREAETEK